MRLPVSARSLSMRILYFAPRECWPPNTGARIRNYHLANALAQNNDVTFAALVGPEDYVEEPTNVDGGPLQRAFDLVSFPRERTYSLPKILGGLGGPVPLTVRNYTSRAAMAKLEALVADRQFDSVQLEGLHLMEYIPTIRRAAPQTAIVSDWHDIQTVFLGRYLHSLTGHSPLAIAKRAYIRRTIALTARAEERFLAACDAHVAVSTTDAAILSGRAPKATITVAPNGVDVPYFEACGRLPGATGKDVIFVGAMEYGANAEAVVWFAHQVWPRLRRHPAVRGKFRIVGRDPISPVKALAGVDVDVTGTVPDVRPYYRDALVLVVPLRVGGGTRLKILEAMAAGVPVVSTRMGAEGLPVTVGENILLADSAEEMALAVESLMVDAVLRERLQQGGRDLVAQGFDWRAVAGTLLNVHESACAARRHRPGA